MSRLARLFTVLALAGSRVGLGPTPVSAASLTNNSDEGYAWFEHAEGVNSVAGVITAVATIAGAIALERSGYLTRAQEAHTMAQEAHTMAKEAHTMAKEAHEIAKASEARTAADHSADQPVLQAEREVKLAEANLRLTEVALRQAEAALRLAEVELRNAEVQKQLADLRGEQPDTVVRGTSSAEPSSPAGGEVVIDVGNASSLASVEESGQKLGAVGGNSIFNRGTDGHVSNPDLASSQEAVSRI